MAKDTKVTANPDGTFTGELSSGPVREPDPTSPTGWSVIDLTLKQDLGVLKPAVADAAITFSDGGTGTLASISRDGLTFAIQADQDLPAPTITGDAATYLDVLPGVDLVLQVRPAGFEQSYLVHAPPKEPLVFDLPLALQGVTATVDERGQLVLTDGDGNQVAQASPAVMFGAKTDPSTDEPVDQAPVSTAVVSTKDGPFLRVSPDPAFFSRPGLTYPVTVDPAPDFSVATDTYVKSTAPSTSYGTDGVLKSGTPDGTEADRTLVSFSGTTVLEDTHVLSATLKLWETHSYSCTPSEVDLYEATSAFTSSTTWNTQPAAGTLYASASVAAGFSGSCPDAWINLSSGGSGGKTLTDLVQEWAWGTKDPYGFLIRAASETNPQGWKKFSSSEAASNHPTLSVSYDIPPPDASDSWEGSSWNQDVLTSPSNYVTDQAGDWCQHDQARKGAYGKYDYKDFVDVNAHRRHLEVDEYDPPDLSVTYPVAILLHGGGWVAGCRGVLRQEALLLSGNKQLANHTFVSQKFIVFSADYRLACAAGSYTEFPLSPLPYLCGWRWDTPDPNNGSQTQVAMHDVEDVIGWIKDPGPDGWAAETLPISHYPNWDKKNIVVLGASAGGNLAVAAAADSANDSSIRPTATAFLSGFPETGQTFDTQQDWSCDSGSRLPTACWTHLNNYLDCLNQQGEPPDHAFEGCKQNGRYEAASPINGAWSYPTTPPLFLANAGFGNGHSDLSPYQLAVDFDVILGNSPGYAEGTNLKFCKVNSNGHATSYLDKTDKNCQNDTDEVIESLVTFYQSFLIP